MYQIGPSRNDATTKVAVYKIERAAGYYFLKNYREAANDYSAGLADGYFGTTANKQKGDEYRAIGEYERAVKNYRLVLRGLTPNQDTRAKTYGRIAGKTLLVTGKAAAIFAGAFCGAAANAAATMPTYQPAYQPTYQPLYQNNWGTSMQLQQINNNLSDIDTKLMLMNMH